MSDASILVVEDDPTLRKMLRLALESDGYRVRDACDADTAIALLCEELPDLVLLDMVLPDASGLDVLACIRAHAGGEGVHVIALTGLDARAAEARSSVGSPDEVLLKPIEPSRLLERVHEALAGRPRRTTTSHHVLLVDDDPVELRLVTLQLRDLGFEVTTATDGVEAIAAAHARLPDAVLSDVMMPGIDGFELCQEIRADTALRELPVVLMSSHYMEASDEALAVQVGADALVPRTPSARPAIRALMQALGTHHMAFDATPDLRDEHTSALKRQLARQVRRNHELLQAHHLLDSASSVVPRLAKIFARSGSFERALEDALYTVLESTQTDVGAIYLDRGGSWRVAVNLGVGSEIDITATHRTLLDACVRPSDETDLAADRDGRDLLEALCARAGTLFPLFCRNERVGALLLAARECDLPADVLEVARAAATYIGLAIALMGSDARLATSRHEYQTLLQAATDSICLIGPDGIILDINEVGAAMVGLQRADIIGQHMHRFAAADQQPVMDEILETGARTSLSLRRRDGATVHVEVSRIPLEIDGEPRAFMISRDVTKKVQALAALRASEERYRSLVESIPDLLWSGISGRTRSVSPNVTAVTGFTPEEMLAESVDVMFGRIHIDDARFVEAAFDAFLAGGSPLDIVYRFQHKNRSWSHLHARGVRVREEAGERLADVLVADVTQQRRLEEQLRMSQKMEAVGQLGGGIAHDFNNVLAVILMGCDLLLESLPARDARRADVLEIRQAGERGANLTRQLLAFSRRQVLEPSILDLNTVVTDLSKMIRRLIGEDIALEFKAGADLGHIRADVGQLEQVIVNLVVNARDAMPDGGRIVIETANVELDADAAAARVPMHPGKYVLLAITDTGCGMDRETQHRIFEPFFTTKQKGKGTGLGLSTSYGIVKQSGGFIWVYSELARGSTFKVYLPLLRDRISKPLTKPIGEDFQGSETVLLIEDDDSLRAGVQRMLAQRGYHVMSARNGNEALAVVDSFDGRIDLVLSDLVMPGGNGLDVVEAIRSRTMNIKAIFMSGYTDHAVLANGELPEGLHFIHKPFSAQALAKKLREALSA